MDPVHLVTMIPTIVQHIALRFGLLLIIAIP